jgi:predicted alpha/beta superfamily hydrolase
MRIRKGAVEMPGMYPGVCIPGTETRTIKSSYVDQEYSIFVGLPDSYGDFGKTCPVVYVLDANVVFGTVVEMVRLGAAYKELPEMIVVGIGYPLRTLMETWAPGMRDFTTIDCRAWYEAAYAENPGFPEYAGSGQAGRFMRFLREELMCLVRSDYAANMVDQTLIGHSAGGMFGLYALFHHTDAFQRYVISSPLVQWEGADFIAEEGGYAAKHSDLAATAFMYWGSLETHESEDRLAAALIARDYPGLKLEARAFEGHTHFTVPSLMITIGLRVVHSFAEPWLKSSQAADP